MASAEPEAPRLTGSRSLGPYSLMLSHKVAVWEGNRLFYFTIKGDDNTHSEYEYAQLDTVDTYQVHRVGQVPPRGGCCNA